MTFVQLDERYININHIIQVVRNTDETCYIKTTHSTILVNKPAKEVIRRILNANQ